MLAAGVPMAIVSKMLRHSSIGITVDTYGHLSEDTARAASDAIGQLLDAAFEAALAEPSRTAGAHNAPNRPIRTPETTMRPHPSRVKPQVRSLFQVEPPIGIEPMTCSLRVSRSAD